MVNEKNEVSGAREARALWRFALRTYERWRVPPPVPVRTAHVVLVETKRVVTNLRAVARALEQSEQARQASPGFTTQVRPACDRRVHARAP